MECSNAHNHQSYNTISKETLATHTSECKLIHEIYSPLIQSWGRWRPANTVSLFGTIWL
jgi:hypothetical protein